MEREKSVFPIFTQFKENSFICYQISQTLMDVFRRLEGIWKLYFSRLPQKLFNQTYSSHQKNSSVDEVTHKLAKKYIICNIAFLLK